jgi:hypothetical protein
MTLTNPFLLPARAIATAIAPLALLLAAPTFAQDDEAGTYDGLVEVDSEQVAMAFINPDADFSVFRRVAILDPHVAFKEDWRRDQRTSRSSTRNITQNDIDRIKSDVAELFKEVFTETLEADNGYEVVDVTGPDVLLVRPAIIDLDITAPDLQGSARTRQYTSTAGAATLYIELFDSVTGEILGRAADRQEARRPGNMVQWSSRVTNRQEAARLFRQWAGLLRSFLDSHYPIGE